MKGDAIICCWNCRRTHIPLRKCGDSDYICRDCMSIIGLRPPEIENQSRIYFEKKKEK
jgi:hypothetical protein